MKKVYELLSLNPDEKSKQPEEFLKGLIIDCPVPIFVLDRQHRVVLWNKACEELTGIKASELLDTDGHWKAFYDYKRPCLADIVLDGTLKDLSAFYGVYNRSGMNEEGLQAEGWYPCLGGKDRYIFFDAAPVRDSGGEIIAVIETLQDITGRKRAEDKVINLNRLYSILSDINQLAVRAQNKQEFMANLCRVIVERGKFKLAWIGIMEGAMGEVASAAFYSSEESFGGDENAFFDSSLSSIAAVEHSVSDGKSFISNNIEKDLRLEAWREWAKRQELCSLAAFPLKLGSRVFGKLNIFASKTGCFEKEELLLLNKAASDISFALGYLEQEEMRREAEAALRESEEKARTLTEAAMDAIITSDAQGLITYWNLSAERIFGYQTHEIIGRDLWSVISPLKYFEAYKKSIFSVVRENWRQSPNIPIQLTGIRKDGSRFPIEMSLSNFKVRGIWQSVGIVRDITERKQVEEMLVEKDKKLQKELQLASIIQSSLFPLCLPQIPGVSVSAISLPASEVGGDYCDLFTGKDNTLGIAIGDVMGKGIPAALFVALTYAFVGHYASETHSPGVLLSAVNKMLFPQLEFSSQFITLLYGVYSPATRELTYANAGHNPPIIYHSATGEAETLKVKNFFLGGRPDVRFREGKAVLEPGDIVFFYTDGLKEGRDRNREQFGEKRIIELLKLNCGYDSASIVEVVLEEFWNFIAGEPLYDDVSVIVIKITDEDK